MPRLGEVVDEMLETLSERYGTAPAPDARAGGFERIVAAFLGAYLGLDAIRAVLDNLRENGLLDASALAEIDPGELLRLVQPGRAAASPKWLAPLQRLSRWAADHGDAFDRVATDELREDLRSLRGLGPATVDAILLHGLDRPVFPVERGGYRVFVRHGWFDPTTEYEEAREIVEGAVRDDPGRLARLAAGLDRVAADCCRVRVPRCERCSLRSLLPPDGPIEPAQEG